MVKLTKRLSAAICTNNDISLLVQRQCWAAFPEPPVRIPRQVQQRRIRCPLSCVNRDVVSVPGIDTAGMYILIYGFPRTHHMWHHIAPALAARFTSVAADIRGHGQSSKPAGVASYAKSAIARDMVSSGTAVAFLRHRARSRRPLRVLWAANAAVLTTTNRQGLAGRDGSEHQGHGHTVGSSQFVPDECPSEVIEAALKMFVET